MSSLSSSENDEGIESPDTELSRAGSDKRAKIRADRRFKRKRSEAKSLLEGGADHPRGILVDAFTMLNTREKLQVAITKSKIIKSDLEKWACMLLREVRSRETGQGDLMDLEFFNDLLGPGFAKFTPEKYEIKDLVIMNKKTTSTLCLKATMSRLYTFRKIACLPWVECGMPM